MKIDKHGVELSFVSIDRYAVLFYILTSSSIIQPAEKKKF